MIYYILIPFLSAICTFILGFIVLLKNPQKKLNRVFFYFSLCITLWLGGSVFLLSSCGNSARAIFIDRLVYLGVIFIPATCLHFSSIFSKAKTQNRLIIPSYVLSVFFSLGVFSNYFIHGLRQFSWGCHTKAGVLHHLFIIYFTVIIYFVFYNLIKTYKKTKGIEKSQTKYLLVAFFVLGFGGIGFLPAYGVNFYPYSYLCGVISVIIITYAIVRHRLMDIRFVLRKYSVYLAALVSIILPMVLFRFIFYNILGIRALWADYFFIIIAIVAFPSVRDYYYKIANKYFFSSLYDAEEVIADLSGKLSSTLLAKKLFEFIAGTLVDSLHIKTVDVFIFNKKAKRYEPRYFFGKGRKKPNGFIEDRGFYKKYLQKNSLVIIEELRQSYYVKYKKTIDFLLSYNIELLIPLRLKDRTIGLIFLGGKEAEDPYNDEDIKLLEIISAQAAIAIDNALNYEKIKNFSKKLEKEVDHATEGLIQANARLKQLDEAKSEFVSIASHQLRTPLTVVKGYIAMILEGNFGRVNRQQIDPLEKVFLSNERLIHLVENLLNISRIESGRLHFNFEKTYLGDMADSVVEELKNEANKKGLMLKYIKPKKKLPATKIDREKMRQVILNLIDNAIKYTKKGKIIVNLSQENENLKICVEDTGMGIKTEDLVDLFEKFSRGTGTALIDTEGTGLGLFVADQMIKAHNGKIWAESEGTDKGSRFCFLIPITDKDPIK